jgi:hypothetical protein
MSAMRYLPHGPTDGRVILLTFVLALSVYFGMVFGTLSELERIAGVRPFDLRPTGYSLDDATALIAALGEDGRHLYLWRQIPLDTVYPALLAYWSAGAICWFARPLRPAPKRWFQTAAPLAFVAALFDYLENALIVWMLNTAPDLSPTLVGISSLATLAKSGFTAVVLTAVLLSMIAYLITRFQRR